MNEKKVMMTHSTGFDDSLSRMWIPVTALTCMSACTGTTWLAVAGSIGECTGIHRTHETTRTSMCRLHKDMY